MTRTQYSTKALNFFKFTLKKQTPITLLVTAFCLLLCPGLLLTQVTNVNVAGDDLSSFKLPMEGYFVSYSAFIFIAALGLMLILTLQNFNFLFSKKSGDMFHSLPLSRNELLFTRIAANFTGAFFTMTASYTSLAVINYMPDLLPVPFSSITATYAVMVLMLFMCTVFTSVFAVCSGGIFDFIIAIGAVNLGLPAIYAIYQNYLENITYGVRLRLEGIEYTTPFAQGAAGVIEMAENGFDAFKENFSAPDSYLGFPALIYWFIITAGSIYLVSRLFAVRRSETAGEAYSFKLVPHIISLLVAICGGYLLGYIFTSDSFENGDFWLFFIFGVVLCSITAGAIFARGFKTVKVSIIRGGVALGLAVTLVVICVFISGRIENYIPEEHEIKSIGVGYEEDVVFHKDYDIVTDIHKAAIGADEDKNNDTYYDKDIIDYTTFVDQFDSIRIYYHLKSGRTVERNYFGLTEAKYEPLFIRYARSDEYLKQFKNVFEYGSTPVEIRFNDYSLDTAKWKDGLITVISAEKANEITEAYLRELKTADASVLTTEPCDTVSFGVKINEYSVEDRISGVRVPHSFTETQALLAAIEFTPETEYYEKYYGK